MKKIIIILVILATVIGISIGIYNIGYTAGKNHTIYTQEIYTETDGYTVIIDGEAHSYN